MGEAESAPRPYSPRPTSRSAPCSRITAPPRRARGEQNIALAVSEARAGEDKRVMTETLEARRSLLKQREDCAKTVLKDVHKRVADYAGTPEYAGTLERAAAPRPRRHTRRHEG